MQSSCMTFAFQEEYKKLEDKLQQNVRMVELSCLTVHVVLFA